MTAKNNSSRSPDVLAEAFELVSRQIDGDLSDAESAMLVVMEANSSTAIGDFRKGCRGLQAVLQQIPVQPVEDSFCRAKLVAEENTGSARVKSNQAVVWGSITVVMAGCLLMAIIRPWELPSASSNANRPVVLNAISPSAGDSADRTGNLADAGLPDVAPESVFSMAGNSDDDPPNLDPSIQLLLESENWKIIVVKLDEKDRDLAMERIPSIVRERGLDLQDSSGEGQSDFVGVVLTSAEAESEELVSAMEKSVADSPVERDQSSLETTRCQEIIEAFRKSLQDPTRSELHHGKVYIALSTGRYSDDPPGDPVLADSARHVAETNTGAASSRESAAKLNAADDVSKIADRSTSAVTLVVFEFRTDEDSNSPDRG